jgi:Mce-associated membrane protein
MAESVKEVVPETGPRGQRRGLDRLHASGDPQASQTTPARTEVRDGVGTRPAETPASVAVVAAPEPEVVVDRSAPPEPPTASPGTHRRVLVAVIALLALLVGWLGYRLWNTHSSAQADKRHYEQLNAVDGRNQAALSAARQAAVTLLTYDYRHLDQDFAAVLNGSTGGFKKDFASRQSTAKSLFVQGKAIAGGQVLDAAVVSSTPTSATALVVIDQSVKNVSVPNGTVKHYRMQLKLSKVGSAWLVSDVEFPA